MLSVVILTLPEARTASERGCSAERGTHSPLGEVSSWQPGSNFCCYFHWSCRGMCQGCLHIRLQTLLQILLFLSLNFVRDLLRLDVLLSSDLAPVLLFLFLSLISPSPSRHRALPPPLWHRISIHAARCSCTSPESSHSPFGFPSHSHWNPAVTARHTRQNPSHHPNPSKTTFSLAFSCTKQGFGMVQARRRRTGRQTLIPA